MSARPLTRPTPRASQNNPGDTLPASTVTTSVQNSPAPLVRRKRDGRVKAAAGYAPGAGRPTGAAPARRRLAEDAAHQVVGLLLRYCRQLVAEPGQVVGRELVGQGVEVLLGQREQRVQLRALQQRQTRHGRLVAQRQRACRTAPGRPTRACVPYRAQDRRRRLNARQRRCTSRVRSAATYSRQPTSPRWPGGWQRRPTCRPQSRPAARRRRRLLAPCRRGPRAAPPAPKTPCCRGYPQTADWPRRDPAPGECCAWYCATRQTGRWRSYGQGRESPPPAQAGSSRRSQTGRRRLSPAT